MRRVHRDNKADGRSKYFYFQTYECHPNHDSRGQNRVQTAHQDSPQDSSQDSPQDPGQEQRQKKRRRVFKKSQKVGCRAKLLVHNMKDDSGDPELAMKEGKKQLRITYYYKHTGHVLGDPNDFQYLNSVLLIDSIQPKLNGLNAFDSVSAQGKFVPKLNAPFLYRIE
ncbi:hypothetical protein BCR41DRAFT_18628 [Lobosporangium transversale]|uniref:Uncharacterized protein n=1 Tax=Lobosporangium transversale TaxID=64571 RepID=A0A1Y2G242_9FUNG|nr:hypothetical protein BCR41DRAFT_18628 [Lobosporangium transversale]ORY90954.1 hypothetical protein BCR41DRAFT_18628 [Lobosporangium transversale]|eukprot:XP_021875108.1 hypothetical protein BCR41DRAFT_18628 [Lobosporangium transversale]